jgi:AbrB family looped-hinge helix DNA binding protein
MLAAKLTDKGQLVIPKCILHALGIGPGSELLVSFESGKLVLEPRPSKPGRSRSAPWWRGAFRILMRGELFRTRN